MTLIFRDRVLMALEHQEPDRPPPDLGGAFTTAINVAACARLRQALELSGRWRLLHEQTQSVHVDEDLRQALGVDVVRLYERSLRPESSDRRPSVGRWLRGRASARDPGRRAAGERTGALL
jgi:hypothetical protein